MSGAAAVVFVCKEELQQSATVLAILSDRVCVCTIYGDSSHVFLVFFFFFCAEGEGPQREAAGGSHSLHSSSLTGAVRTAVVGVLLLEHNRMDGIFGGFFPPQIGSTSNASRPTFPSVTGTSDCC